MKRLDFLFKYLKPGKILDVGNLDSQGKIHEILIAKLANCEIYGLDTINQNQFGLNFSNQYQGSFEQMDFADDFFDTVYLGQVFEHTWKPKQALDECYRVLKPGGVLILDTPNVYSLSRILRYLFTGRDIILGNPDHKIFFSRAMLENVLCQSGFKVKIIATERNFAVKGKLLLLPDIPPFNYWGECFLILAEK